MNFSVKAPSDITTLSSDCLVIAIPEAKTLTGIANQLGKDSLTLIKNLFSNGDIKGKCGDALLLHHLPGVKAKRVLLLGIGKEAISIADFQKLTSSMLGAIKSTPAKDAILLLDKLEVKDRDLPWQYQQITYSCIEKSYQYKKDKKAKTVTLKKLSFICADDKSLKAAKKACVRGQAIANGSNTAKHLGNLPANICTPSYLASQAKVLAGNNKILGIKVLDEKQMKSLGMHSLLSVTAGSDEAAKLIVLEYKGATKTEKPHVLVGKAVTFDSGGISLKPGAKMDEMKYDMCGGASVLGAMTALAELKLKINVVAIIAATENLPSGSATKPGDVVTSMSGQTIEILNTDAEGRLVLCDALTYAERFKPQAVIDIATLTGACVVALGKHATAMYSNNEILGGQLKEAGDSSADRIWPMPLWDEYQKQLDSNFADMANIGGPEGGSITAACFLSRFAKKYPWAHLDIAGTAWIGGAKKGATGRPVPLLVQYLLDQAG